MAVERRWNASTATWDVVVGAPGVTGPAGAKGSTGSQGSPGPAGSIADDLVGAWAPSRAYVKDDVVTNQGNTYVCITAHTSSTSISLTNFREIAQGGGAPGAYDLFRPGYWFTPGAVGSNGTLTNNVMRAVPMFVTQVGIAVGRMALTLTTAGAGSAPVLRYGLYGDDGSGIPGSLLVDGGTVAATSANTRQLTIATTGVGSGVVWLAVAAQGCDVTAPVYQGLVQVRGAGVDDSTFTGGGGSSAPGGMQHTGTVSGSLPTTFVPSTGFGTTPSWPRLWIKCV